MADTKISALTALTGALSASDDLLVIVDTSATATKKITLTELQSAPVSAGTANGILYLNGSKFASSGSALTFNGANLSLLPTGYSVFGASSAEAMRLTATGLGIGTSSPGYKLTVAGTSGSAVVNLLETGVRSWGIRAGGTATNTFDISDLTAGATRLTLNASGNLGLGVTPSYKLHVGGAIGFAPGASVAPVSNGDVVIEATNNTTLTFKLKGSDGTVRSGTVTLA